MLFEDTEFREVRKAIPDPSNMKGLLPFLVDESSQKFAEGWSVLQIITD